MTQETTPERERWPHEQEGPGSTHPQNPPPHEPGPASAPHGAIRSNREHAREEGTPEGLTISAAGAEQPGVQTHVAPSVPAAASGHQTTQAARSFQT